MSGVVFHLRSSGELGNIVKVASIYITTIIGAGFASGQEIVQFFSKYYEGGFLGILLAGLLFSVIGCIVLGRVYRERIRSYDEFLFPTLGWLAGWIVQIAVTIFTLCLFCIMIAGSGNVLSEKFGLHLKYSVLIMGIVCLVFILTNIKGIVSMSTFAAPILIGGILLVGFYIIIFRDQAVFSAVDYFKGFTGGWFFSSLLYVSYNSIMAIVVMCSLLPYLKTERTGKAGGILGGAVLCVVALVLNTAIYLFFPESQTSELPVLNILGKYDGIVSDIYAVVLWLAMFTSAVTSGFCFVDRVCSKVRVDRRLLTIILCAVAVPLSTLGFSNLISAIYPVFGYIGLFVVAAVLIQGVGTLPSHIAARKKQ
jgi:uncharacterized membrane protein YkvI